MGRGGGTFLPPLFYDMCDQLGIMLMHDFMLSWYPNVPYPAYPQYRARIRREVQQKLTELARHPAIVVWNGGNEDQCTKYDQKRSDACRPGSTFWYPNCDVIYRDCVSIYIDTVLQTAASCTSVPLWPVSPSAGWASGVDTATGIPNGVLVEKDDAVTTSARWNQGGLDVHGPYGSPKSPNTLERSEGHVLFHSEFGELSLPQFETIIEALPRPEMWGVNSAAQAQRSPNGAKRITSFVQDTLGSGLVNFDADTEGEYRRLAYLSQLAQSESLRVVVDGGRLGVAAGGPDDSSQDGGNGASGPLDRPWGYLFWQLNDVTQGNSWGSLEYGGRLKIVHYASRRWFAPVRVECNTVASQDVSALGAACSFEQNVDYASSDMKSVKASDKDDCCKKCDAMPSCAAGVFTANNSQCWIKSFADLQHKVKARTGIPTVACITNKKPAVTPHGKIACTIANDGDVSWSGNISLAVRPMGATAMDQWTQTFHVKSVLPGHAQRFLNRNATGIRCAGAEPCWMYGQIGHQAVRRADIGVPLASIKDLVNNKKLPRAHVNATILSISTKGASIELSASQQAVALYVHLTVAPKGQWADSSFHLLQSERRTLSFHAWEEEGPMDAALFAKSLRVHWLNA